MSSGREAKQTQTLEKGNCRRLGMVHHSGPSILRWAQEVRGGHEQTPQDTPRIRVFTNPTCHG